MGKKVMVAMSGGVDSSVAAWLLLREGYEVIGVTMKLWGGESEDSRCCGLDDVRDAQAVCRKLGVPHYVFNYKEPFLRRVVEPFIAEYQRGRTPNPCILCNRHLKFGALLQRAKELGIDYISTGHYARVGRDEATGRYFLRRGKDGRKDQSYVLYTLTQSELQRLLLPCGDYSKEEIRAFAQESGLPVAHKPDSQDICFVPDGDYAAFLERYTGKPLPSGYFIDKNGQKLGPHQGLGRYTIGQRKGLGIALGKHLYVSGIDPVENTVTLVEDESLLYSRDVLVEDVNFLSWPRELLEKPAPVQARIRYSQGLAEAEAVVEGDRLHLRFSEPQRAATPGQAAVVYRDDLVICGGTIVSPEKTEN